MTRSRIRRALAGVRPLRTTAMRFTPGSAPLAPGAFAAFGSSSWIVPPTFVVGAAGIEIGSNVAVLERGTLHCAPGAELHIGDGVVLGPGCCVYSSRSIHIGTRVSASDHVTILDSWGPAERAPEPEPVVIEAGAYLGCGAVIGPGVRVGAGAFVGEGSHVLSDVEPHTVVYGSPAVVVRRWRPDEAAWVGARFP